jgi:hypothetical protein
MFAACPSVFYQHGDLRWGEHPCTRGPEEGRVRKLKADRVEPDGSVICVDPESGEEFTLAVDDTLRAAVLPASATPTVPAVEVSPREIQARIRAGATVAELSTATGVAEDKIHRFAHPVLLERMRAAELARASHPGSTAPVRRRSASSSRNVSPCAAVRRRMPSGTHGDPTTAAGWSRWAGREPGTSSSLTGDSLPAHTAVSPNRWTTSPSNSPNPNWPVQHDDL